MEILKKLEIQSKDITVLYVEDDKELNLSTTTFLKKIFTIVDSCYDGENGLFMYKQKNHDLVITDIKMPKMDGIEMIKSIRSLNPSQVVLVISAFDFSDLLKPFLDSEVNKFLPKPIEFAKFISTLLELTELIHQKEPKDDKELSMIALNQRLIQMQNRVTKLENIVTSLLDKMENER